MTWSFKVFGVAKKIRRNAASVQIHAASIKRHCAMDPDLLKKSLNKQA